jgi:phosphoglycerol transferase
MREMNFNDNKIKSGLMYTSAILLTLVILIGVMKLWHADLTVPFGYNTDFIFSQAYIKEVVDNGWFLNNRFLGAPFGANMYDYPNSDGLTLLLVKVISIFTQQVGIIVNFSFLLTFFLTTATSLYVFRKFGISRTVAVAISLLYSFLPYHFLRGEMHFFLSFYFQVPLLVMIILWIINGEYVMHSDIPIRIRDLCRQKKFFLSALICFASSSMGVYYAFFACFFLLVAGLVAFVRDKKISHIVATVILVCALGSGVILNIAPKLIYSHNHGTNTEVGIRSPVGSEIYGLKITQFLLPVGGHRIHRLAAATAKYNSVAPLPNEGSETLGLLGSIGFLLLLFVSLFEIGVNRDKTMEFFRQLATLNIAGVLLATIGGFGSLFAFLISPEIRAYNRISVFIAFLSLFALGLFLDKLIRFINRSSKRKWITFLLPLVILGIGIFDQTTALYVPDYIGIKNEYKNDAQFVQQIQSSVPSDSMIFQLPYVPFPENPPVNNMGDYDLFRGYLHSQDLRWSYGTMKGRVGDGWYKEVSQQPLEEMLKTLSFSEFNGIYIDRYGYKDQASKLIADISKNLDEKPIFSNNQRLAFFNLEKFNKSLRLSYTTQQYDVAQDNALHPLLISWKGGFSGLEGDTSTNWRWCSSTGQIELNNSSDKSEQVEIQMSLATGYSEKSNMYITGSGFADKLLVNNQSTLYTKTINVPPGEYIVKMSCDAKRVEAPQDSRLLVFRIENFKLKK